MAPHLRLTRNGAGATLADSRRLEELSLNASGAFQSLAYDGWLVGYRRGPTKRLRCVNPFYPSSLPLEEKVDYCTRFYAAANLPAIFRLLPFSQPSRLDTYLERAGWGSFERTLVLRAALGHVLAPALPDMQVDIVPPPDWEQTVASLLDVTGDALQQMIERAKNFPLPHAGAIIRRNGAVVACGLLKLENEYAGLFAVHTASAVRGTGLGRAIVAALLAEAVRHGARTAYLQVTADNAAALALYRHFAFTPAYDYWYRARPGEQH
jgi:ribosomal protein S18 acetylase RimI-like enzyme